jgi:plastocyanin
MTSKERAHGLVATMCALALAVTLAEPAQAATAVIRGIGTRWSPASVTIARGALVKWRGVSILHDVVAYGGNWSLHRALPEGSVVKRRFRVSGTFRFRCTYHSALIGSSCHGMCGSIVVRS